MSKKKTTAQPQSLSPEKYIRQKSRKLPIYKCWISNNWEKVRFGNITIARQHANGNVTFCTYLVDLACLGVKDTLYAFNVPIKELEERLTRFPNMKFEEISYPLAHNIIYAAIEFAEEYGFQPHKDYTQTTSYFLEEDTDDIPLMEIKCGSKENGKPFYINAGHDSPERAKQIIAHLEKTAGNGNYNFLTEMKVNKDKDDWEEEEDYDEDFKEGYEIAQAMFALEKEEQKALFFELYQINKTTLSPQDFEKWIILSNILANDIVDKDAVDDYTNVLEQDLDYSVEENDELPNSLFSDVQSKDPEVVCNLFFETLAEIDDDAKKAEKAIAKFHNEMGDVPVAAFMELLYLARKSKKKHDKKLEEYYTKYPDYFLMQLKWHIHLLETQEDVFQRNITITNFKSLLSKSNQSVTYYESEAYIAGYLSFCILLESKNDPIRTLTQIIAFERYLTDYNDSMINKRTFNEMMILLSFTKTSIVAECLK
jgi:hypothetical protein